VLLVEAINDMHESILELTDAVKTIAKPETAPITEEPETAPIKAVEE